MSNVPHIVGSDSCLSVGIQGYKLYTHCKQLFPAIQNDFKYYEKHHLFNSKTVPEIKYHKK